MSKYKITYESRLPGLETQVLMANLTFERATQISAEMQAEAFLENGDDVPDGTYTVQPYIDFETLTLDWVEPTGTLTTQVFHSDDSEVTDSLGALFLYDRQGRKADFIHLKTKD